LLLELGCQVLASLIPTLRDEVEGSAGAGVLLLVRDPQKLPDIGEVLGTLMDSVHP
jgi:hypothetical protein